MQRRFLIAALGLTDRLAEPLAAARPLDGYLEVDLPFRTEERTGYNVAAAVRGQDPELLDQWVFYVAHYDHVGRGGPGSGAIDPNSREIHNGGAE